MKFLKTTIFFCCISLQILAQFSNDPALFARQLEETIQNKVEVDYQFFYETFFKTFESPTKAQQFLKEVEQYGPQNRWFFSECMKLSLCVEDIVLDKRFFDHDNLEILYQIATQKQSKNNKLLWYNFGKQRENKFIAEMKLIDTRYQENYDVTVSNLYNTLPNALQHINNRFDTRINHLKERQAFNLYLFSKIDKDSDDAYILNLQICQTNKDIENLEKTKLETFEHIKNSLSFKILPMVLKLINPLYCTFAAVIGFCLGRW
ncbi:hypothetical protein IPH25_00575 [bacterium]|nr:MAG: hypothetical protein IPG37_02695 [bacterium]QQR61928.1 MAG: hypothetical protein IPH25_00575 [bacterium]QQR62481.1 MAG: hypothetical protein IPH67_03605 [bacterium]